MHRSGLWHFGEKAMYRTIECHTWDDEWFQELEPAGKLVFLYLLTNIRQTACGAFHVTLRTMAVDTGLSKDDVKDALDALQEVGKVAWWPGDSVVWVKNFYRYQRANSSDKFRQSAAKVLRDFPQAVQDTVVIAYPELASTETPSNKEDTLPIPYEYPTDREPIGVARITEHKQNIKESVTDDSCAVAGATSAGGKRPRKEKYELPSGYTKELWGLLKARFGTLTWSNSDFIRETEAVRIVVQAAQDTAPVDIADYLWYVATCDEQWKADKLTMPLLSKCKANFGRWLSGGKPKGVESDTRIATSQQPGQRNGYRDRNDRGNDAIDWNLRLNKAIRAAGNNSQELPGGQPKSA